jgi:signal transduction histidine kinase
MSLSIRWRIVLTLAPLVALLAAVGVAASVLLLHLGGRIDAILRENYESVRYMERLNEAVERIDSAFTFALSGQEKKARRQYDEYWKSYREWLRKERGNITEPGEAELVARLGELTDRYADTGDAFWAHHLEEDRRRDYYADDGLLSLFEEIKKVSGEILLLNQRSMERARDEAHATARDSLAWFAMGAAAAATLAAWLAWRTVGAVLRPIQALTNAALAIGTGDLDQAAAVSSPDELGRLAEAFNTMARQLRHFRQTDYSRLLRAQRTGQATIDSFPDPVFVLDSEGRMEMANPAAQRLFGFAGEGAAPTPWRPPEALRGPVEDALLAQRPYLPEGFDRVVPLKVDDKDRDFLPRVLPIRDPYGNALGAAVLLEDVTRFHLLDQVKSDLVATVSHELKTPLTSLRLALHLLLEETVGPLTPKQTELLMDARDNGERLLAMVNNLLDLARLEREGPPLSLRAEAPAALLAAAAEAARPRAADKDIELTVEAGPDLPAVKADAARIYRALGNLLDNALEHTERGGHVRMSAELGPSGEAVNLTVADDGRGIPPEHLPHVFERFFRVPGQGREGGTGLGLAIVREIAEAHGGSAACHSAPGGGTEFSLTLLAAKEQ